MRVLDVRNVHEALPSALDLLYHRGVSRDSRAGEVIQHRDGPVATVYRRPDERVIFHSWRDANPFFHFYESLWMLAGRRDLPPLLRFLERFRSFSDDGGKTQNAAYGFRWRHAGQHVGRDSDQLQSIVDGLIENQLDRQLVLQIWDHTLDLRTITRDHACNIAATFQVSHDGKLDLSLFCRSNDILWGCYGANAVHMSMMHEYVSRGSGIPMGAYTQISVNWHAYVKVFTPMRGKMIAEQNKRLHELDVSPYRNGSVTPYPLMSTPRHVWDTDVYNFITENGHAPNAKTRFRDPFFVDVAMPIVAAHDFYKDVDGYDRWSNAYKAIEKCAASDWRKACLEWLDRRRANYERRKRAIDDGVHAASEE